MSLFNPFEFNGKVYKTAREVKEAKRLDSLDAIRHRRGIRGFLGSLLVDKQERQKLDANNWTQW